MAGDAELVSDGTYDSNAGKQTLEPVVLITKLYYTLEKFFGWQEGNKLKSLVGLFFTIRSFFNIYVFCAFYKQFWPTLAVNISTWCGYCELSY